LALARRVFSDFESLHPDPIPAIRSALIFDPVFGPLTFVGVLLEDDVVELASVADDPYYWEMIENDPDD